MLDGDHLRTDDPPVRVTEAVVDPFFRVVELGIPGLSENLIVIRIEHPRLGNVDWIISRPSSMVLRDILNQILARAKISAV